MNKNRLLDRLDELINYPLNYSHEHYLSYLSGNLQLINMPKFPKKNEQKINEYNKQALELNYIFLGCERLVEAIIIKNTLKYLNKINVVFDDNKKVIPWEFGNEIIEPNLSKVLVGVLKDRILKGYAIDRPLLDSIDPTFYDNVVRKSSEDAFKNFLTELNNDVEYQRTYGCLKLFKLKFELTMNIAKELRKYMS